MAEFILLSDDSWRSESVSDRFNKTRGDEGADSKDGCLKLSSAFCSEDLVGEWRIFCVFIYLQLHLQPVDEGMARARRHTS